MSQVIDLFNYPDSLIYRLKFILPGILLLFLFIKPMNAQNDCLDPNITYVSISSPKTISAAITEGLLLPANVAQTTSQFIYLTAELEVDIEYEFAPGSEIVGNNTGRIRVFKKLIITNSEIHGCASPSMAGFILEYDSELVLVGNHFYEMDRVVNIRGNNLKFTLTGNTIEKTRLAVEANNCKSITTNIYGNTFYGTLPSFAATYLASVAFSIKNVQSFKIGDNQQARNDFINYDGTESMSNIRNYAFINVDISNFGNTQSNIEFENNNFFCNDEIGGFITELKLAGESGRSDQFTISNCSFSHTFLTAFKLPNLTVEENSFRSPYYSGLPFYSFTECINTTIKRNTFVKKQHDTYENPRSGQVRIDRCNYIEVSENIINDASYFEVINCVGIAGIIDKNVFTNPAVGIAISIYNTIGSGMFSISDNFINTDFYGIDTRESGNLSIDNNLINNSFYHPDLWQIGISSVGNENIMIYKNKLTGPGIQSNFSDYDAAIWQNNTTQTTIECNEVKNSTNGITVSLQATNGKMIANSFDNTSKRGIFCFEDEMKVTQNKFGNRWNNISTSLKLQDDYFLDPLNPVPTSDPDDLWIITSNNGVWYQALNPVPYDANVVFSYGPISRYEDVTYCQSMTIPEDPKLIGGDDFIKISREVMQGKMNGIDCTDEQNNCAGTLFTAEYHVLTLIHNNRNLLTEYREAADFWNAKMNEPIGELFLISKSLEGLTDRSLIAPLMAELDAVNTQFIYESNLKEALKMKMKAFISGSKWSPEDTDRLRVVADQCPQTGGKGVDISRSLLHPMYGYLGLAEGCEQLNRRGLEQKTVNVAEIYPNPASDQLFIQLDRKYELCDISVFDLTGKKVLDKRFEGGQSKIRLPLDLEPNMYFIQIVMDNEYIQTEKLNVIK